MRDTLTFFQQFRERFETTGAVAPSSRFLAGAITGPLRKKVGPARILEVGPGTGACTQRIVRHLGPEDRFDLVELNEVFAGLLRQRFERDRRWSAVADRSRVHVCPIQEFQAEGQYDYIISGLPLNNFPAGLVREIFDVYFRLLAPGGVLSYFEYMFVRPIRKVVSKSDERTRLRALDDIIGPRLRSHRFRRSWVFINVPPAWVQHLRHDAAPAAASS